MAEHFTKQGWKLVARRFKTPFSEVDLLFEDQQKLLVIVEVKSVLSFDFLPTRLSPKQKGRLIRSLNYFLAKGRPARLEFAAVDKSGKILLVPEIFL